MTKKTEATKAEVKDDPKPVTSSQDGHTIALALMAAVKAGKRDAALEAEAAAYLVVAEASDSTSRVVINVRKQLRALRAVKA